MTAFHVMAGANETFARPAIRKIGMRDVGYALRQGIEDFKEKPSHYVFLCLMYPVAGIFLVAWSSGAALFPLLFPLMSGFALLGPLAAIGLYEISKRREAGMDTSWRHALDVLRSPAMPSIVAVGLFLVALFVTWLVLAEMLYTSLFGDQLPLSLSAFARDVATTEAGLSLILWGNLTGLVFAIVVLTTTVVAFPLLLDRDVGAVAAIDTSIRAAMTNPLPVLAWGLIVAVLLVIGTIPLFAGLAVVMPILGHATWHFYRRLVAPAG